MAAAAAPPMTSSSSRRLSALSAVFVLAVCCLLPAAALGKQQYRVGGEDGWRVPPPDNKDRYYGDWASNITFYVDDTLEFVYENDSAVLRVSKAGYYHCNETAAGDDEPPAPHDGRTVFLLDAPGDAYFASADLQHCGMGERLAVAVLGLPPAPSPTTASAPGPSWSWVLSPSSSEAASPSPQRSAAAALVVVAAPSAAHAAVVLVGAAVAMAAGLV